MQRRGAVAVRLERLGQLVHFDARPAEDDGRRGILELENAAERGALLPARHDVGHLADAGDLAGLSLLGLDRDALRLLQVPPRNRRDPGRHGRREQRGLPRRRRGGQDGLEVLGEAHVQHLVGFVEDEHLERRQVQRAASQVIERAAGRGHDHLDAALQGADLLVHRRAAVDGHHGEPGVLGVLVDGLGHLHRQLARGHEDQGARCARLRGGRFEQTMEQRQCERGRLAGAGAGLADDVPALEQHRNGGALNGGGFFVSQGQHGLHDGIGEAEGVEAGRFGGVVVVVVLTNYCSLPRASRDRPRSDPIRAYGHTRRSTPFVTVTVQFARPSAAELSAAVGDVRAA